MAGMPRGLRWVGAWAGLEASLSHELGRDMSATLFIIYCEGDTLVPHQPPLGASQNPSENPSLTGVRAGHGIGFTPTFGRRASGARATNYQ